MLNATDELHTFTNALSCLLRRAGVSPKVPELYFHFCRPFEDLDEFLDPRARLLHHVPLNECWHRSVGFPKVSARFTRPNLHGFLIIISNIILDPFPVFISLVAVCVLRRQPLCRYPVTEQARS